MLAGSTHRILDALLDRAGQAALPFGFLQLLACSVISLLHTCAQQQVQVSLHQRLHAKAASGLLPFGSSAGDDGACPLGVRRAG